MAEEPPTNEFDNESEEMTDFDRIVEEMLTEEKEKISETSSDNDPLYTGCRLSLGMSMLLIVTFVMRHGLTGVALCDLLNLVELHCLAGNICRSSIFQYRQYFESLKHPLVLNYYCESCYYAMLQCTDKCPNCTKSSVKYYITIPIKDQLETILKRPGMLDEINKTKQIKIPSTDIRDVYDGKLYKEHFNSKGFFQNVPTNDNMMAELHLSLQINTDGVAIFRSSKCGVWPVYAVINELPPHLRFTRENRLFLGLWFGVQKPNMKVLFKSVLKELDSLFKGIAMDLESKSVIVKTIILSAVADAPARCLMMDLTQFNGFYGCPCCYATGETFAISEKGNSHIYLYNIEEEYYENGHDRERTDEDTMTKALQVEKNYVEGKRREPEPILGVKGISFMSLFPTFKLIRGNSIDYMHCVLLGVVKMLIGLWVDNENKQEIWSIHLHIDNINNKLKRLSPHRLISRLPRNIDDDSEWKASEYRSFLLFYSLPLLSGFLPPEYYSHYSYLVSATYLLLKSNISQLDLKIAKSHMKKFCMLKETLYGEIFATFNTHCLLHLCAKVEDHGPLWAHSCFFYEGLNGDLRKQFHGTQQVDLQIVSAVCVQQTLPELVKIVENGPAKSLYQKMVQKYVNKSEWKKIGPSSYTVGLTQTFTPTEHECTMFKNKYTNIGEFRKIQRIHHNGFLILSRDYKPEKRRNSYTISCTNGNNQLLYFVECATDEGYKYAAVVKELVFSTRLAPHISQVVVNDTEHIIDIDDILEPLMYVEMDSNSKFIAKFPNFIEKD